MSQADLNFENFENEKMFGDIQLGNAGKILDEGSENPDMLVVDKGSEQHGIRKVYVGKEKEKKNPSTSLQLHDNQGTDRVREDTSSQLRQPTVCEPGAFKSGDQETKYSGLEAEGANEKREARNDSLSQGSSTSTTERKDGETTMQNLRGGVEGGQQKEAQPQPKTLPATIETNENGALVPKNLEELWRLAKIYHEAKLVPAGLDTPAKIFTALQFAGELGLRGGYVALKNIYIVNGIPNLWGNLPIALVEMSGKLAKKKEWTFNSKVEEICIENKNIFDEIAGAACTTWRIKGDELIESTTWFTVEQAKKAGLWTKNIWKLYPDRMLQCRARAHNLNDSFADVLMGAPIMEYNGTGCANEKGELVVESEVQSNAASKLNDLVGAAKTPEVLPAEGKQSE